MTQAKQYRRLGKFELHELIGEGAMGVVWKAYDSVLRRYVALKLLPAKVSRTGDTRERFLRGARAAGVLQPSNIVTIYALGEAEDQLFIAMELVDGRDLSAIITEHEPLPLERKLDIVIEVLEALTYAHNRGVIHRDIKPSNVRIATDGGIKIMDFGIARLQSAEFTGSGELRRLQPRDPEVHDLDAAVRGDAHVRRFDVAVDHAAVVGVRQRLEHLDHDIELALERQRLVLGDDRAQVAAVDQLHRDEELVLGFAEVVDRDDVGVLQHAGGARLAQEALTRVAGATHLGGGEPEGDVAPQHRVVGLPHDAHGALADELVQLELAESPVLLGLGHPTGIRTGRAARSPARCRPPPGAPARRCSGGPRSRCRRRGSPSGRSPSGRRTRREPCWRSRGTRRSRPRRGLCNADRSQRPESARRGGACWPPPPAGPRAASPTSRRRRLPPRPAPPPWRKPPRLE